jgi:hypothetical protein
VETDASEFKRVTITPSDPRFGFEVDLPPHWAAMDVPAEEADFSSAGTFQPIAVFAAQYGLMVLTFAVRPGPEAGTLAEWFARACQTQTFEVSEIGPAHAGDLQAIGALGRQDSDAGPMNLRVAVFEQGGWAHLLTAMAPAAVWDSLSATFDRMFASFAMTQPMPSTVPIWPTDGEPADDASEGAGGPPESNLTARQLADARETADRFLTAVSQGDEAAARSLLIADDSETVDFNSMADGSADFTLGEVHGEGDLAIVATTLKAVPPGQSEAVEQAIPMVLRQDGGQWKVDIGASMKRLLGFDLEEAMTEMAKGLGETMSKGMEAMAEGMKAAFEGARKNRHGGRPQCLQNAARWSQPRSAGEPSHHTRPTGRGAWRPVGPRRPTARPIPRPARDLRPARNAELRRAMQKLSTPPPAGRRASGQCLRNISGATRSCTFCSSDRGTRRSVRPWLRRRPWRSRRKTTRCLRPGTGRGRFPWCRPHRRRRRRTTRCTRRPSPRRR